MSLFPISRREIIFNSYLARRIQSYLSDDDTGIPTFVYDDKEKLVYPATYNENFPADLSELSEIFRLVGLPAVTGSLAELVEDRHTMDGRTVVVVIFTAEMGSTEVSGWRVKPGEFIGKRVLPVPSKWFTMEIRREAFDVFVEKYHGWAVVPESGKIRALLSDHGVTEYTPEQFELVCSMKLIRKDLAQKVIDNKDNCFVFVLENGDYWYPLILDKDWNLL